MVKNRLGLFTSVARVVAELAVIVIGMVMLFLMPEVFARAAAHFDLSLGTQTTKALSILLGVGFAAVIFSALYGMPHLAVLAGGLVLLFLSLAAFMHADKYFDFSLAAKLIWLAAILLGVGFIVLIVAAVFGVWKKGIVILTDLAVISAECFLEIVLLAIGAVAFFLIIKLLQFLGFSIGDFSLWEYAVQGLASLLGMIVLFLAVAAFFGIRALWKKIRPDAADEKETQPDGDGAVRRG